MIEEILSQPKLIIDTIDKILTKTFSKSKQASVEELSGRILLARNAIIHTIKMMLKVDAERAPFQLLNHEQEVSYPIKILDSAIVSDIKLGGFVDRIEQNEGTIHAIDYKTGKYEDSKGKFEDVDELFSPSKIEKRKEVFQTFCYSLALTQIYPDKPIKPSVWFIKNVKNSSNFDIEIESRTKKSPVNDFREFKQEFEVRLTELLSEIFSQQIPFSQTTDAKRCKTCPYNGICGKD